MKKSLTLMLAAISAVFFACSDDSSSDNGTGGGSVTVELSGSIVVDTLNKTIITLVQEFEDECVNKGAGVYNWESVDHGLDTSYSKYEFIGDTLVVYDCEYVDDDGDFRYCDDEGQMMVGGKAGKLDGTWKTILCMYDTEDSESTCFTPCSEVSGGKLSEEEMEKMSEEMEKAYAKDPEKASKMYENMIDRMTCLDNMEMQKRGLDEGTVKISGNEISTKSTQYYDLDVLFDDFMNSEFMSKFYRSLANEDPYVPDYSYLIEEDSSDVEEYKESANVEVLKQTKSSVTFKVADQTVSVDVDEYDISLDLFELSMSVSVNGKSCQLQVEEGEVTEGLCKSENGEFFEKSTIEDASGNKITIVSKYEKSNEDEYENCTESLMDSLYAAIRKNNSSSSGDDDCDEVSMAYSRCMHMDDDEAEEAGCSNVAVAYNYCVGNSYPDDYETSYDPAESFSKKAVSDRELAKKKFLKISRKFSRMLKKLAK